MDWLLIYDLAFGASLVAAMVSLLVFARFSMRHIERSIVNEGKPRPCSWDGVGGRVFLYAWRVALPAGFFNAVHDRMLNTADVKRYSTKGDRIRAWMLMVPAYTFIALVIVGWVFDIAQLRLGVTQ